MRGLNKWIKIIKIGMPILMGFLIVNFFHYSSVFALGDDGGGGDPEGLGGWMGIILAVGFYLILISLDLVRTVEAKPKSPEAILEKSKDIENYWIIEKYDLNFLNYKILNLKTSYYQGEENNIILNFLWEHWNHIIHSLALLGGSLIYYNFKIWVEKPKNKTKRQTPEEKMDSNKQTRDFEYEQKLKKFRETVEKEKKLELEFEETCWKEFHEKNPEDKKESTKFEKYKKKKKLIHSDLFIEDNYFAPLNLNDNEIKK